MEERWNLLDPSDKSYYKQKMTENKQSYESMKRKYFTARERLETYAARENINFSSTEVSDPVSITKFSGSKHAIER